jgi:5-dehydro-2-deoxygluconokinase
MKREERMKMDCGRIYMLASDHRWQWEEWCDKAGMARDRISEIKQLVLEGFVRARSRSADVRAHGSLLLDNKYGVAAVARAKAEGYPVGTPVERAGVFPLEWEREPFHALSEGNSFCKVLIRYRPEWPEADRRGQMDKLLQLQDWCRQSDVPLLVEIIIMKNGEDERDFEERGRPQMLGAVIREAYGRGLVPDVWKIEGTRSRDGARTIDAAIRERPEPRQVILGKGADPQSIASWFDAAAALSSTAGFAIGRSVFMDPARGYLTGVTSSDDAIETIASRYLALIEQWKAREGVAV